MDKNSYIFLDIDGVLVTSNQYYSKKLYSKYNCCRFDKKCVSVFNEIINEFNPIIILSSDWKNHFNIDEINNIFRFNDVNTIINNITPNLWGVKFKSIKELEICRANEILKYVDDNNIKNYIAIDDLNLDKWLLDNFIHTPRSNEGIKQTGVKEKIINKLKQFKHEE